jgi:hypothetical protein
MPDIATVVDTYIATWNEPDADRRRALAEETFSPDGSYVDPLMSGEGAEGIAAMIGGARAQFPGHRFVLAVPPDAHHDVVRFAWQLVGEADGSTVAVGQDFATVADDGRLRSVVGFLEQPGD